MNKPELLAPAGDLERLQTAIRFGADAVYVGGPVLQLRADAASFSMEQLAQAVELTHAAGRRLYVTVNCFVRNGEVRQVGEYARALHELGVDAVIVSDLGAICAVKAAAPDLEVHISTQANCLNWAAACHYYDMGASRVVLAREATLDEIVELRAQTPKALELECFVHGAMCMAYSGRCLLSAYLHGRSGNRGDCAQPCRYRYALCEEGKDGEYFPSLENERGTMLLSSRDLNAMPFLNRLTEAGVNSLKIEGRMKSTYYVATVVNAYRHRLDGTAPAECCLAELDCASHREYTSGFYFGPKPDMPPAGASYRQECTFIALVLGRQENGRYLIEQRNRFCVGDRLELLSPNSMGEHFVVEDLQTEDGEPVQAAPHPQQRLSIACPLELAPGDLLRRRVSG